MMTRQALRLTLTLAIAVLLMAPAALPADEPAPGQPGYSEGPEWVGPPVTPSSWDGDIRDLPPVTPWKPGDPIIEIPRRFYADPAQALAHAPFWLDVECDPLVAKQAEFEAQRDRAEAGPNGITSPVVNIDGNPHAALSPPDVAGDVGPNHYIQAINGASGSTVQIYDKAGTKIGSAFSMVSLGGTGSCTNTYGDPIVLYDRLADRWFLQEFTNGGTGLCIHISKTSDPVSGGWWNYTFDQATFPDYPHCSVWWNGYYCTANEGNPPIYVFDRTNMLAGNPGMQQTFRATRLAGYGFQALTPVTFVGAGNAPANAPFIAIRHNDDEAHSTTPDTTHDFIDMFSVAVNWTTPASSVFTTLPKITISEFNSWFRNYSAFDTVPQPTSTKDRLDPIREVILNRANYMNFGAYESIVGTFATNIDPARTGRVVDSGVRWFELRRSPPGSGSWALYQEGTYGDGGNTKHHLEGSIIMNKAGDLGMGFNVTQTVTPYIYASVKYTGRYSTDSVGVMTQGENDIVLGSGVETSGRWGDYPTMSLDPVDDCTFWFTHEYRPASGWATRIASFKILPAAPAAPSFTNLASTSLTANWAASGGSKTYNIYRSTGGTCSSPVKINASPVAGLSYSDSGLSPSTQYSYYIVGSSECGTSANGTCNTVTTPAGSVGPLHVPYSVTPTTVKKNDATGTNVAVSFDNTNCSSSKYHIIYGWGEGLSGWTVSGNGGCNVTPSASATNWSGVPDATGHAFLWFLVVGDNGSATEGSWGLTSGGAERGGTNASNQCSCTAKNTTGSCGTP